MLLLLPLLPMLPEREERKSVCVGMCVSLASYLTRYIDKDRETKIDKERQRETYQSTKREDN